MKTDRTSTENIDAEDFMRHVAAVVKQVEGVSSMSGSFTDAIPGFKSPVKGVKISEDAGKLTIELYINVFYHSKIPQLAWDIQKQVKNKMESLSDVEIKEINIHVRGVEMPADTVEERNI